MSTRKKVRFLRGVLVGAIAGIGVAGLVNGAAATPIASDSFSYALGEVNGQAGGSGWGDAWTGVAAASQIVDPGAPLSYSVSGGGTVDGGDRALAITGNSNNALFRDLASPIDANDAYFSFLLQFAAGAVGRNNFTSVWVDNSTTGQHLDVPSLGLKGEQDGGGPLDFFSRVKLNDEAYSSEAAIGETHLIVAHLSKSNPGPTSLYDRFDLWIDPEFFDSLTPDRTSFATGTLSQFFYLGIRSAFLDPDDLILVDELRVGTAWADAVPTAPAPVPEPGTMVLLGTGLLGVAGAIRRRRS